MRKPSTTVPQPLFVGTRLLVFSTTAAVAVTCAKWLPGMRWGLWLSVAAILIAVWHGAFDGVLAKEALGSRFGAHWKFLFYVAYLALGAGLLLLWWRAPVVALSAFLLYSALHFGTESEREFTPERLLTGLAAGFVPVAAACHWWPQQVAAIFALMLRGSVESAALLTAGGGRSLWPVVTLAALGAFRTQGFAGFTSCALVSTELVLFHSCTPVLAFALFFCLWHTPEHLLSTSTDCLGHFQPDRLVRNLRGGFGLWLVSVAGVGVVCALGRHEVHRYVGVLFIALSALTVPHMVLGELCRQQEATLNDSPEQTLLALRTVLR